jgi:hypothetical protein
MLGNYDRAAGEMRFYFDGVLSGRLAIATAVDRGPERIQIGSSPKDQGFRHIQGWVSQAGFMLFWGGRGSV